MELEERICPTCNKSFRVHKKSKQKYDSKLCIEFKNGKIKKMTRLELLNLQRRSYRRGVDEQR